MTAMKYTGRLRWRAAITLALSAVCLVAQPDSRAQTVRTYSDFPSETQSESIVYDALGDGRIMAWDGGTLWIQSAAGAPEFSVFFSGIQGDPAFLRVAPDGDTIVLGSGGSDGEAYAGEIMSLRVSGGTVTAMLVNTDNHQWADFLTDTQLLVARHDPDSATDELLLMDTTATTVTPARVLTGVPRPIASFAVDRNGGEVFVGLGTGEIRVFPRNALNSAAEGTPLTWASGTVLSGSFGDGGPSAVTANGLLAIGGEGSLTLVNKNTLTVVREMDPAGQAVGRYTPGYNAFRGEVLAMHQLGAAYGLYAFDTPANCLLRSFRIKTPVDRSTWYGNQDAGGINIQLTIASACLDDIDSVTYRVVQPGELFPVALGVTRDAPFDFETAVRSQGEATNIVFIADAQPISSDTGPLSNEVRVTFAGADSGLDADGNGLPDLPYTALDHPGDRWVVGRTLPEARFVMTSSVAVLYGFDPETDIHDPDYDPADDEHGFNDIRVVLTSDEDGNQRVEVVASEFLLRDDEIGMLIVQIAPDLTSLLGTAGAEAIGSIPRGDLEDDGLYVQVGFLVSDNEGFSFSEISGSRLSANPIQVAITGQPLRDDLDYALRAHPTVVTDNGFGIEVLAETGSWRTLPNQSIDYATGTLSVELTSLQVIAPFEGAVFVPDESGGLPSLLAILYGGLLLLGLADGGGGGPCFIATAAYGTPLSGDIDVLRDVRDTYLLDSALGTAAVDTYYRLSPGFAGKVAASPVLAALVRTVLTPCIAVGRLLLWAGGFPFGVVLALMALLVSAKRIRVRHGNHVA